MSRTSQLSIAILATLFTAYTPVAWAVGQAQEEETAEEPTPTEMDTVSVTGSRIGRSEIEGPSPVTILGGEELQKQGFSTVRDALLTVSQATGQVDTDMDQAGGTPNGQFVNLRGLGPGYTLVLLNGKRVANYPQAYDFRSAAVSLGSIPTGAIERVEILSGGSSAIYGSDAVAGVINIITKSNFDGDEFRLRGGVTGEGGGDSLLAQWVGGRSGDRWTMTYALEHHNRSAIGAWQRDFMDSNRHNPAYRDDPAAAPSVEAVYLNVTGTGYVWPDASGNLVTSPEAAERACHGTNPGYEMFHLNGVDRCGDYAYDSRYSIQNEINQYSGLLSVEYDITPSTQVYANALATKSDNRGYNKHGFHFYSSPTYVYDQTLGEVTLRRRFTPEEFGHRQEPVRYNDRSYSINAGLKGFLDSGFDWDFGLSHSSYETEIKRRFFVTDRLRDYFLGELSGYTSDGLEIRDVQVDRLFSPLPLDAYEDISTVFVNRGESEVTGAQFVLTGDLFDLPAGTVQMATVVEAVREKFLLLPDERTRPDHDGDRIFNWTAVVAGGERDRYALGVEFSVPLLSTLSANVAGRYDRYDDVSDVGGALTWQAGLEWRPLDSLLLRSTYATSFRAPEMTYLFSSLSSNFYWLTDIYNCRLDGLAPSAPECTSGSGDYYTQVQGTYSGNSALEEEKGNSLTVGMVWDIAEATSLSVDYYRIELENSVSEIDRIFLMGQEADCRLGSTVSGEAVDINSPSCQFYTGLVERNDAGDVTSYSSYPINQSMSRTEGVDVGLRQGFDLGSWGRIDTRFGYTIVVGLESQLFPGDEWINERDNLQYRNFRSKANWQGTWSRDAWQATVYGYRWGSLPNYATTDRIGPHIIWNAGVSRQITPNATLRFSVNNLFNRFHPRDDTFTSYPYFHSAYSPVGREMFFEVIYEL